VTSLSFRARILVIVLLVGVLPLALLGLWTTRETGRSGERLLRTRLTESLDETVSTIVSRWYRVRSDVLDLTDLPVVVPALRTGASTPPPDFVRVFERLDPAVTAAVVTGLDGTERWEMARSPAGDAMASPVEGTVPVTFAIRDRPGGQELGALAIELRATGLLPAGGVTPPVAGTVVGLFDAANGLPLIPHPLENRLLSGPAFTSAGDRWLAEERVLSEPPIRIVVAAPLTPFVEPFQAAARRSAALVLAVTLGGVALAALLTSRLTHSLRALSIAADAVAAGELDRRVEVGSRDEVGRVADAFNTMTESLDRTMRQLAKRESLAAVGQFAATLAHEVRNPLTAIRVDLQIAEDELQEGSVAREAQERALREVMRLNETVSDTLRLARSSPTGTSPVDVRLALGAAVEAARPMFEHAGGHLEVDMGPAAAPVDGDAGALEQLFLNLLQNAAQALDPGGRASLTVEPGADGSVVITIADDGAGMTAEVRRQVFEPLFTTRPDGTGLGLTIAQRIASAHGGDLTLESAPNSGTVVTVQLPVVLHQTGVDTE
jgi:signal transduction histidine kinase